MSEKNESGRVVGDRYKLEKKIGEGGQASVYLAKDLRLRGKREVAVKIFHINVSRDSTEYARFNREIDLLAECEHEYIVNIKNVGEDEGRPYIVMEYLHGTPLRDLLQFWSQMPWRAVAMFMVQLCEALEYAHDRGIIHRDIKPDNCLITRDPRGSADILKLLDLGIAKKVQNWSLTKRNALVGSWPYMAPEQFLGKSYDHRVDIYSSGVMMYELLTGGRPYDAPTLDELAALHVYMQPKPPSSRLERPRFPSEFDEVVLKALSKDPEDRFATAKEFGIAVQEVLDAHSKQIGVESDGSLPPRTSLAIRSVLSAVRPESLAEAAVDPRRRAAHKSSEDQVVRSAIYESRWTHFDADDVIPAVRESSGFGLDSEATTTPRGADSHEAEQLGGPAPDDSRPPESASSREAAAPPREDSVPPAPEHTDGVKDIWDALPSIPTPPRRAPTEQSVLRDEHPPLPRPPGVLTTSSNDIATGQEEVHHDEPPGDEARITNPGLEIEGEAPRERPRVRPVEVVLSPHSKVLNRLLVAASSMLTLIASFALMLLLDSSTRASVQPFVDVNLKGVEIETRAAQSVREPRERTVAPDPRPRVAPEPGTTPVAPKPPIPSTPAGACEGDECEVPKDPLEVTPPTSSREKRPTTKVKTDKSISRRAQSKIKKSCKASILAMGLKKLQLTATIELDTVTGKVKDVTISQASKYRDEAACVAKHVKNLDYSSLQDIPEQTTYTYDFPL